MIISNGIVKRLVAAALAGLLACIAGASLSTDRLHVFLPNMTSGRGFIGLAATLLGGGVRFGTAATSLVFGFFGGDRLQVLSVPSQFVLMLPHPATILVFLIPKRHRRRLTTRPIASWPRPYPLISPVNLPGVTPMAGR